MAEMISPAQSKTLTRPPRRSELVSESILSKSGTDAETSPAKRDGAVCAHSARLGILVYLLSFVMLMMI